MHSGDDLRHQTWEVVGQWWLKGIFHGQRAHQGPDVREILLVYYLRSVEL
jgi:hypothetical protein